MPRKKTRLTKQEMCWIDQYFLAEHRTVDSAYRTPSETKRQIEAEILYRMKHDFNGFDYRILSYNGFHFSCGFKIVDGDNYFLCICTPSRWWNVIPVKTVDSETGEVHNWYNEYYKEKK